VPQPGSGLPFRLSFWFSVPSRSPPDPLNDAKPWRDERFSRYHAAVPACWNITTALPAAKIPSFGRVQQRKNVRFAPCLSTPKSPKTPKIAAASSPARDTTLTPRQYRPQRTLGALLSHSFTVLLVSGHHVPAFPDPKPHSAFHCMSLPRSRPKVHPEYELPR
jgi:hypothetical protein